MKCIIFLCIYFCVTAFGQGIDATPEQIIVAYAGAEGEMTIQWVTFQPAQSLVMYGDSPILGMEEKGDYTVFVDPTPAHIVRYIHNVLLTNLLPDTVYFYQVGDPDQEMSPLMQMKTLPPADEVVDVIVYGDFGLLNAKSLPNLLAETDGYRGADMILHVGDWAYDFDYVNGTVGDQFMNMIQPFASKLPYIGNMGNHEMHFNATHYTERLRLYDILGERSDSGNNWWYSWEFSSGGALIHMVSISTEVYYKWPNISLLPQLYAQYEWLKNDLAQARQKNVDWLIVYGHRPMYCSNVDDLPDCSTSAETLRKGINGTVGPMEILLGEYDVDIYFTAHEHSYERCFPVYDGQVDIQDNHTYINPKFPVHILSGAAGNHEELDSYDAVFYGPYSAVRSASYGYGHLKIYNQTHLYWEQMLFENVLDQDWLWIVKQ